MSIDVFARASTPSLLHAPRTPRFLLAGGLAACSIVLPQAAFGADRTWNGGGLLNNNWGNNNNWAGGSGISPLDSLLFGGTIGLTNNNNTTAGTQYNGLTFNSGAGAFVLGGNWIKLGGNVTNNSTATQTINFGMELVGADRTFNPASGSLVINGQLSGTKGIVKSGSNTLVLGGANTYSGGTTINAGTVDVARSLGLGTGQVTFGDTGTLVLRDQASAYANAVQVSAGKTAKIDTAGNSVTFGGAISGAGTFEKVGAGTLRLAGANTSTGGTKLTDGTLQINNHLALGDSSNALTVNGGTLDLRNSSVNVGALSGTGGVITSTFDNNGVQSDVYLNTTVAAGTTSTFSGSLQSGVRTQMHLQKEGAGTLVLNGTNFMLDAQINAGTLEFGRTDALAWFNNYIGNGATLRAGVGGTVDGNVVLESGRGTFDTQNFDIDLSGGLYGSGTLVKSGGGRLTLSRWENSFWGGSFEIDAGTLKVDSPMGFMSPSELRGAIHGGATLDVQQAVELNVTDLTVNGTVRSATGGVINSWLTVGGTLDGLGSIVGNLRSAGILDGSQSFTGNVVVAGQHFAGDAGVHSITGNLEYATVFDISSVPSVAWALFRNSSSNAGLAPWDALFDQALVGGNLAFSSATSLSLAFNGIGSTVNWSDAFWSTDRSWTIWRVAGSTTGLGNLTLGTADWRDAGGNLLSALRGGNAGFSIGLAGNGRDVVLSYTAVPAPGALGLVALAGLVGGRRRRA